MLKVKTILPVESDSVQELFFLHYSLEHFLYHGETGEAKSPGERSSCHIIRFRATVTGAALSHAQAAALPPPGLSRRRDPGPAVRGMAAEA